MGVWCVQVCGYVGVCRYMGGVWYECGGVKMCVGCVICVWRCDTCVGCVVGDKKEGGVGDIVDWVLQCIHGSSDLRVQVVHNGIHSILWAATIVGELPSNTKKGQLTYLNWQRSTLKDQAKGEK